ncbi:hypothetical protein KY334_02115 [Candidatus Woesearchaeota archaeon]|nr:hypothetical protein [Candidatus Woesearchaeota archaeon]
MNIDKEQLLISHLRQNSRERLTKISRQTSIPISTLFDMLKKTDKIVKHTCLADFSKLGYSVRATVILKTIPEDRDKLRSFLLKNPNTNSVWKINNGFDYMVEMIFKNICELEFFVEDLEKVHKIVERNIYYIIDDIAREIFMSNPQSLEMFDI